MCETKEFRVKKNKIKKMQSLYWILCKGTWETALKSIFDNLLNLELLEKYLISPQVLFCVLEKSKSYLGKSIKMQSLLTL